MLPVRRRAIAIVGLVALLGGLAVWYGSLAPAPALGDYPDQNDLATDYERYLGEEVSLGGRVVDTDPPIIVTTTETGAPMRLTVTDLTIRVTEGEELRVYGVVEPDRTIRAKRAFTISQSGHWYAWLVSFLAGIWVLGRFSRYWCIESTDWTLARRHPPLVPSALGWVGTSRTNREDDDA